MDINRIEEIARHEMESRKEHETREPGWIYYHGLRTARISVELCSALQVGIDRDVLFAGALFHDIGKGTVPHNKEGAELTKNLLGDCCTAEQIAQICEIVELHNQRHNSRDHAVSVRIVQDADLIDHVGPIGSWLAFYWSGTHKETVQDHTRFITGEENRKYRDGMRSRLNFDFSRQMFDERVQWEDEFFSTFRKVYFEGVWHNKSMQGEAAIKE